MPEDYWLWFEMYIKMHNTILSIWNEFVKNKNEGDNKYHYLYF